MEGLEELKNQMDKGRDVGDACRRKNGSQNGKNSHECHVDSGVRGHDVLVQDHVARAAALGLRLARHERGVVTDGGHICGSGAWV